jgi:hypothetical protein
VNAVSDDALRDDRNDARIDAVNDAPSRERAWIADVIARRLGIADGAEGDAGDDAAVAEAAHGRLAQLSSLFDLSPFESDVIAVLWVTAFDPALRAACLLHDRLNAQITPRVVAAIFGHAPIVRLPSGCPLRLWQLVEEHPMIDGSAALSIDPQVIAWLQREPELDRALLGHADWIAPAFELPSWPIERWIATLRAGLERGLRWRVRLETDDRPLAAACAAAIAHRLQLPLLKVDVGAAAGEAQMLTLRAHRQAFLDGCALYFEAPATVRGIPVPFPLQFAFASTALSPVDGLRDLSLPLAVPTLEERRLLWRSALTASAAWPLAQLEALAVQPDTRVSDIARVAATEPEDATAAIRALRTVAHGDFDGLAHRIDAGFGWDDLVLPPPVHERLAEIAFEARERDALWADPAAARLYPQGRGLVALFAGAPGTGKTMAAQVIASEIGLDLWRVDVSAVLSKWVGETAQHLQKILSSRTAKRAVLFFDEADALYGKRVEEVRDAQDRYANMDISHLMVALENYDGIILMATNLRANIDAAFLRRIRHFVEFPRPDPAARRAIWQRVVAGLFGADALRADDIDRLARLDATGAQIKNAALSAAFVARRAGGPPDARLFGRMLARELAKDGAGLSQRDLDAMLGDGA